MYRHKIRDTRITDTGETIQEGLLGDKTLSTLSTLEVIFGIFEPTVPSTTVYRTTVAGSVVGLWQLWQSCEKFARMLITQFSKSTHLYHTSTWYSMSCNCTANFQ